MRTTCVRGLSPLVVALAVSALGASGCFSSSNATGADADAGTKGPIVGSGLPCDVEQLLVTRCQSCHGTTPTFGTPMSLVTYTDLMAPAPGDATRTVADVALERMQSADKPMPPPNATPATADEIAVLQNWIKAGYAQDACDLPANGGDPYGTSSACSTNQHWKSGDLGSSLMHPGVACITCHDAKNGPAFYAAGTVFKTAHEPDDCNGVNGASGAKVVITDAAGQTVTATVNAVGNFYWAKTLKMPIHAKVVAKDGKERVMAQAQTTGDCNSCHIENGKKNTPGRIMMP
jgi:hypothetical protein